MIQSVVYFIGQHKVEVRQQKLTPLLPGEVIVKTICSAISPGTEMLLYKGYAPQSLDADISLSALSGKLGYPLKYGYATIGKVVEVFSGLENIWIDKLVFGFQPHQSYYKTSAEDLMIVPYDLRPDDGVFLPNMETAINFVMDGAPKIGEKVVVFGQGIVGLLTTGLLALFPLEKLISFDMYPLRRKKSFELGADEVFAPNECDLLETPGLLGADLVYELTGNPQVLNQAISASGFGGRVIMGSWYGQKTAPIDFGGYFHRSRINIISSQVSTINPTLSGLWSKERRFKVAWKMIQKFKPSDLITHRFPLDRASDAYQLIDENPDRTIQVIFDYPD